jgi:hypothetical protein
MANRIFAVPTWQNAAWEEMMCASSITKKLVLTARETSFHDVFIVFCVNMQAGLISHN